MGCAVRHEPGDPLLGQPICADCFDYEAAVLWNGHVSELWRRTRIDIYRQLARLLSRTERQVMQEVRVEYVKVAEYQRRGLLHYHAAVRLDAGSDRGAPPPEDYTVAVLSEAITAAVAHVEAPYPEPFVDSLHDGVSTAGVTPSDAALRGAGLLPVLRLHDRPALRAARWGTQLHLDPIKADDVAAEAVGPLSRGQVAGYLAKYATKHTEALGALDRRVRPADLPTLAVNPHVHRLVATSLLLGLRFSSLSSLARWAHQLGCGGHWLTKSRRWSTTFGALRAARRTWQAERNPDVHLSSGDGQVVARWQYTDNGYRLSGDEQQAATIREEHELAREEIAHLKHREKELAHLAA